MNIHKNFKIAAVMLMLLLASLACRQARNTGKQPAPTQMPVEPTATMQVKASTSTQEPTQETAPTQSLAPSSTPIPTATLVPSLTPGTVLDSATQDLVDQLNNLLTDLEKKNAAGDNLDNLP